MEANILAPRLARGAGWLAEYAGRANRIEKHAIGRRVAPYDRRPSRAIRPKSIDVLVHAQIIDEPRLVCTPILALESRS
jgi:hypothetical protein